MLAQLMEQIAANATIDEAYEWLCRRRVNYTHNDEVWTVRERWRDIKPGLQRQLLGGTFSFSPLRTNPSQRRLPGNLVRIGFTGSKSHRHRIHETLRTTVVKAMHTPGRERRGKGGSSRSGRQSARQ